jgi:hypothetical protein
MAKTSRRNGRAKPRKANGTVVAMTRRFAQQGNHTHKDRRERRRDRSSWRRDEAVADGRDPA